MGSVLKQLMIRGLREAQLHNVGFNILLFWYGCGKSKPLLQHALHVIPMFGVSQLSKISKMNVYFI